jgi:hypothetical protein
MRRFTGNQVCGTKSAIFGRICVRIGPFVCLGGGGAPLLEPYGGASGAAEAVAEGRERRADCFRYVLTLQGGNIQDITAFVSAEIFASFGLPQSIAR